VEPPIEEVVARARRAPPAARSPPRIGGAEDAIAAVHGDLGGWGLMPLESEHAETGSEGTAQLFACTRLRYTRVNGVYKDDIGRQLQAAQREIAALRAQLAVIPPQALTEAQRAALKAAEDAADALKRAFS
jgi:hypothetical protein